MVFGYKRKPLTGYYLPELLKTELPPGDKASYCRPIPPANAITNEEYIDSPKSHISVVVNLVQFLPMIVM
jgi:hypothetical protein